MQSVELSYARYMFFKDIGIEISENYYQMLFINQKDFIRMYKINNQELRKLYNYDDYILNLGIVRKRKKI